jgi:butanol dehydrogenase
MLNFKFNMSTKIIFGKDRIDEVGKEIKKYGNNILMVYGGGSIKQIGLYDKVVKMLKEKGIQITELGGVKPNPRISSVREGVKLCKEKDIEFILPVGGGSTIDCSKAIAAGSLYDGDPWDFFIGKARIKDAIPLGTILTLSATGSEMNGNAVVSNPETEDKLPIRSSRIVPVFSLLDPTVTYSLPPKQTSAGVVDIYSHVMEQYFCSVKDAFVTDKLSEGIFKTCIHYGPIALKEPKSYEARANLMWASTLALNGLLSMGKTRGDWATHAIEHEVSAIYDLTHGVGLAIIAPNWMEYVYEDDVDTFYQYAKNVWGIDGGDKKHVAKQGIEKTRKFFKSLNIPVTLKEAGIDDSRLEEMAKKATRSGDIGDLKKLNSDDVLNILKASF